VLFTTHRGGGVASLEEAKPPLEDIVFNLNSTVSGGWDLAYGPYALAVIAASIGVMAIAYGAALLPFNPLHIPAWLFGPLGAYTVLYGVLTRRDSMYYALWGSIMAAIAASSALYEVVNPLVIVGVVIVLLVIAALVSRARGGG